MKLLRIEPRVVEYIPDQLAAGVLYISDRFRVCSHLCCCGCREEVVTPLSEAEWKLTRQGALVSLWPSIGNWDYACQSHYIIERNQVRWAPQLSCRDIARVKQRDRLDLQRMIANQLPVSGQAGSPVQSHWSRVKAYIRVFLDRIFK